MHGKRLLYFDAYLFLFLKGRWSFFFWGGGGGSCLELMHTYLGRYLLRAYTKRDCQCRIQIWIPRVPNEYSYPMWQDLPKCTGIRSPTFFIPIY